MRVTVVGVAAAAMGLVLTGCGATPAPQAAAPSAAPRVPGLTQHQAKQAFYWDAAVHAPSLAQADRTATLHAGQDVCDDLGKGWFTAKSWAGFARHYDFTPKQTVAIVNASVDFLCPGYAKLVERS